MKKLERKFSKGVKVLQQKLKDKNKKLKYLKESKGLQNKKIKR